MELIKIILRGASQVMFQNNIWCGLLFIVGIFWGSYETGNGLVAWGALLGLIVSTSTGFILDLPDNEGEEGLWGFNGILVGCAFPTFMGDSVLMWLSLILCAMMSTWVYRAFNNILAQYKVSSFTFSFVFTTWIFLLASRAMDGLSPHALPSIGIAPLTPLIKYDILSLIEYWLKGISQVFLVNSWVTGAIFLLGLFISNKWAGIWAAVASAVSLFIAILFSASGGSITEGLYGFSAVLTGLALGMTFYKVNIRTAIWALLGIIATVFIQAAMNVLLSPVGIPTLTGPFCLATWLFLLPLIRFDDKGHYRSLLREKLKKPRDDE
jgi:urea transporter